MKNLIPAIEEQISSFFYETSKGPELLVLSHQLHCIFMKEFREKYNPHFDNPCLDRLEWLNSITGARLKVMISTSLNENEFIIADTVRTAKFEA
jgi:hypothetical protein